MDAPPPPPPPHGQNPKSSSGLPPGNYDIFIIPPHSSGGGFVYLPSMRPNTNSFVAGFASCLFMVVIANALKPAVFAWWSKAKFSGGTGTIMFMLAIALGAWAIGRAQSDGGSGTGGASASAGGGTGGSYSGTHAGASPGGQSHTHSNAYPNGHARGGPAPPPPQSGPPPGTSSRPPPHSHPTNEEYGDNSSRSHWERETPTPEPKPQPRPEPQTSKPPPPPPPPPEPEAEPKPQPQASTSSAWEKAREETRRKEEERKAREAEKKRREELDRKIKEMRAKEAREQEARDKKKKEEEDKIAAAEAKKLEERKKMLADAKARMAERKAAEAAKQAVLEKEKEMAIKKAAEELAAKKLAAEKEAAAKKAAELSSKPPPSTYAFSSVGERMSPWPNGKPPSPAKPPPPPSPPKKAPPAPSARTYAGTEDDSYSYRPYDKPQRPAYSKAPSSVYSDSTYASQTTSKTSQRGPYSTQDPNKIQIKAVYAFTNAFVKTPTSQLISGVGSVTDGLILRITTEGLFIDDDVRGVPQREWDVKAWTMKLVEVWCPSFRQDSARASTATPASNKTFRRLWGLDKEKPASSEETDALLLDMLQLCKNNCRLRAANARSSDARSYATSSVYSASSAASSDRDSVFSADERANRRGQQTGQNKDTRLHVLRASIRDQEGKKYVFVITEEESWKISVGLQRLRKGSQVRALGVSGMSANDAKGTLENLGW